MSASEKLKTLNDHEAVEDLRDALEDALPQILAVVEAAEAFVGGPGNGGQHLALLDALAALEEALG